jgi:hypothetical protein
MGSDGFHRNGSSLELESWSDFDFSSTFDDNNSKRLCGAQIIYTFFFFFFFFFFCRGGNKIFWKKY